MHILTRAELRHWLATAPALPVDQDHTEVRLYALGLQCLASYWLFLSPLLQLLYVPGSILSRVAALTLPYSVTVWFALAFVAMLPHIITLVFLPHKLGHELPRKMAGYAAFGAAVLWGRLGTLAIPLDAGLLPWLYWVNAGACVMVALLCGFSVNAQQLREQDRNANSTSN